jgi:hypothetical protein
MRFSLIMLPRIPIVVALILCCGLAGCATAPAPAKSAQITDIKGLFPKLEKDMSADVIRQKLGAPAEIKPMDAPAGKAEVWVYHFEKSVGMTQVATGTVDVPTFSTGISGSITSSAPVLTYSMAEKKSMVTLSLLMFNGRLAAQKAMVENRLDYQ